MRLINTESVARSCAPAAKASNNSGKQLSLLMATKLGNVIIER